MKFKFKESHTFEQRQQDSTKIKNKYAGRVPVVVERHLNSQIVDIDKHKFLVPDDVTVAQFMWIIRKRIDLSSEKALFLFVGKTMPQARYISLLVNYIFEAFLSA
ncbi:Gamma-aminobutyric acid receptor-associated protein-like 2 [Schistosoma japonicum]|nr:Gamma-aminobutyric acid receptor-associated protein-like 2 [Schistosoma japonicum]